jgi:hypothetical protein
MADPFTIRIFVPDGDPEGVRLIDRMNWTGLGLVFPRAKWPEVRKRQELHRTGIYILVGYSNQDDDLPTLYIGQADGVGGRIETHYTSKDFWDWGVVFVSNSGGLNRAMLPGWNTRWSSGQTRRSAAISTTATLRRNRR